MSVTKQYSLDDVVTVNVSGKKYFVSRSVLLADPKNKLIDILHSKQQKNSVRTDNIYLDLDPKLFRHVLHYLRCLRDKTPPIAALPCKADELAMLMTDAQSLRLEKLLSLCATMLKRYLTDETTSCEHTYVKQVVSEFEHWVDTEEGW